MYDEIFNPNDLENEHEAQSEGSFQEVLDIEFPTPKKGPSLDEMMRKYGFIIFKEWTKANQESKNKNV